MTTSLTLIPILEQLYIELDVTDVISLTDLRAGLKQLEAELLTIAVDVNLAFARGGPLRRAVHNDVDYPHLHRAHAVIGDLLEHNVEPEIVAWARCASSGDMPPIADDVRTLLAREAAGGVSPQSLAAHFILFEVTCAVLKVAAWRTRGAFESVGGTHEELEETAESSVERLIAEVLVMQADVRPFHILVAHAMERLTDAVEELRERLRSTRADLVEHFAERAAVIRSLRDIDPTDAALLQNMLAPYLREQYLSIEQLQRARPLLVGVHSRSALDQRASRLRRRARQRRLPRRTQPSLYQLLDDIDGANQ